MFHRVAKWLSVPTSSLSSRRTKRSRRRQSSSASRIEALESRELLATDVFDNVPEAANFTLAYELPIPNMAGFRNGNPVPYAVDNTANIQHNFDRIAYYLELDTGTGKQWVYASMDAFTSDVTQIGLPHNVDNPVKWQQIVSNMNVESNVPGIATGTGIQTGNVEFWSTNYNGSNAIGIPNADGGQFDFGDGGAGIGTGHGSFQIHNHDIDGTGPGTTGQTLFGYSDWGGNSPGSNSELGIGTNTGTVQTLGGPVNVGGRPDWTFADSAHLYTVKNLAILVRQTTFEPSSAPDAPAALTANAPELVDYQVAYHKVIPTSADYRGGVNYDADNTADIPSGSFDRVAYYLQLDGDFVEVSFDSAGFTNDATKIGIPNDTSGEFYQQILSDMNVSSNVGGVTTGTGIATGNIEFWSTNYGTATSLPGIGGDPGAYDFNDTPSPGGHGSMQIHNHGAGETIFAYNQWNNAGATSALGIGNQPTGQPDWTFNTTNIGTFTNRDLYVLVRPAEIGTPGNDDIVVSRVEGVNRYTVNGGDPIVFSDSSELIINGLDGNDTLTVDFSGGDPIPSGGLTFNGNGELGNPGDTLVLTGGSHTDVTYDYVNASDGSITLDGSTITYTGLEPITNSGDAVNAVFNLPTGSINDATLTDNGATLTLDAPTFEMTVFNEPTGSLTINNGTVDDAIVVTNSLSIASNVSINVPTITLSDDIVITGGNAVDLNGNTQLAADIVIDTSAGGGGNIDVGGTITPVGGSFDISFNAGAGGDVTVANSITSGGNSIEEGGMFVVEAERFTSRTAVVPQDDRWLIVPDEDPGAGTLNGARGTYVQSLPDQAGGGGGPLNDPTISYAMQIDNPGTYELYLRWANNNNVGGGGNSDSIFVDIVELKDGTSPAFGTGGNVIPDWYELVQNTTNFNWDGGGQAEVNSAGAANNPITWNITAPGIYTLRVSQREDGSAVDAFVFQESSLPAPTGVGPAETAREFAMGDVTIVNANNVTIDGNVDAASLTQVTVAGTTTINGDVTVAGAFDILEGSAIVNGDLTADSARIGVADADAATANAAVNGGAVTIGDGDGELQIGVRPSSVVGSSPTPTTTGTFDLENATSVDIDVTNVLIGNILGAPSQEHSAGGNLLLSDAGPNTISATLMRIGHSNPRGNAASNSVNFGGGVNDVNVNTLIVGGLKSGTTNVTIDNGGTLNLTGDSNAEADLTIAGNNVGTGANTTATFDMTGGTLNATLDAIIMSQHPSGSGSATATFLMDAGTVTANSVGMAANGTNTTATLTMQGGMFTVNGNVTDGNGDSLLNIEQGDFIVNGNLNVDNVVVGYNGGNATLTVDGGSVNIGDNSGDSFTIGRTDITNTATVGTADFSAATSVTINVGDVLLGTMPGSANPGGTANGNLELSTAGANVITADDVILGDSPGAGNGAVLNTIALGAMSNEINADFVTIGGGKSRGTVTMGAGGALTLNGTAGPGNPADLSIGINNLNTGASSTGIVDLSGGTFNAEIGLLRLGQHGQGNGNGQGTLIFDAGSVTTETVILAAPSATGTSNNPQNTTGEITMNGGTFTVNGSMTIGFDGGDGTFTANGGDVNIGDGNGNLDVARTTVGSPSLGTLDLAGASSVMINVTNVRVGTVTSAGGGGTVGTITLPTAGNATVNATTIIVADSNPPGNTGVTSTIELGGGSNDFVANQFRIGDRKSHGQVIAQTGGTFSLEGAGGPGTGTLDVGLRRVNTGANGFGLLDLSAAANVDIDVDLIRLGNITASGSSGGDSEGRWLFSNTANTVSASSIVAGDSPSPANSDVTSTIVFGAGTNDVNVDTFTLSGRKSNATATITAGGTLTLSGNANAAADLIIGDNDINTGTQSNGLFDLTGGTFDATLDELRLGRHGQGSGQGDGELIFDAGVVVAQTVVLGEASVLGTSDTPENTTGTITMNGGSFTVNGSMIVGLDGAIGTFNVNGGTVDIGSGAGSNWFVGRRTEATEGNMALVSMADLSGAAQVTVDVDTLGIGTVAGPSGQQGRPGGTIILGADNDITADEIIIADSPNVGLGGHVNTLSLGPANMIDANTIRVGGSKGTALLNFATPGGTAQIGSAGDRPNVLIGDQIVGTGGGSNGTIDFTGSDATLFADTLTVGSKPNNATGATTGTVTFDMGTIDANAIELGVRTNAGTSGSVTGTINQNGGTLRFGTLSDGGGTHAFNFAGGTIQNQVGGNAVVQDVTITLTGAGPQTVNADAGQSITIAAAADLTGNGAVEKAGDGALIFAGATTYTGNTAVNAGFLQVDGSTAAGNLVTVNNGGTLSGSGAVGDQANALAGGTIAPGPNVTTLTVGDNSSLVAGAVFQPELSGATTAGTDYDQLVVTGGIDLGGSTLDALLIGGYLPMPGDSLTIITTTGGVTGQFLGLDQGDTFFLGGQPMEIDYTANGGNDVVISFDTTIVVDADDESVNLDNDVAISLSGTNLVVTVDGNTAVDTPLANVTTLTINGQTGNDIVTIDYTGGSPFPTGGIFVNGDANVPTDSLNPLGDTVEVTGGGFGTVTHDMATADSGTIALDTDLLTYTTLENPADVTGSTIDDLILNLPAGADAASLSLSGTDNLFSAPTVLSTLFGNPTASLTVNTDGTDSVELNSVAGGFDAAINVVGDADDSVTVTGNVDAGSGTITVGTDLASINFAAGGSLSTTGSVSLSADVVTSADPGVDVIAGDLTVAGGTSVDLDTTVTNLTASTSGTGNVVIDETDGANLVDVSATDGDVTVTSVTGDLNVTSVAASGSVSLTATAGAITDANGPVNNVTASDLAATAGSGIDLDTTVDTLTASVTGTGDVSVANSQSLIIASALATDGSVDISSAGDLTLPVGASAMASATLSLTGGDGGVTVAINGTVDGGTININGGTGADTIVIDSNGGTATDGGTVDNVLADLTVSGGGGSDTLTLDDSGDATADNVVIDSTSVQGLVTGGPTISLADIQSLFVNLGDAGNTVNLDNVHGGALGSVAIEGGAGDDTFDVTPGTTAITINANAPTLPASPGDTLNLDLTSIAVPLVFPATSDGTFPSTGNSPVNWTSIESFTVNDEPVMVGDLFVEATPSSDRIIFYPTNDGLQVRINSEVFPTPRTSYSTDPVTGTMRLLAYGRGGSDQIIISGRLDLPAFFDGGIGNDYLASGINNDTLIGGEGNDVILAGEGDNILIGDDVAGTVTGNDRLEGRSGIDTLFGGSGNDRLNGGAGDDLLDGGTDNDFVFGGLGNDVLIGRSGVDTLTGYYGDDVVLGGDSEDQIFGGEDNDLLLGGLGADRVRGDGGDDSVIGGTSQIDSDVEAAFDDLLADLGSSLSDHDLAVANALNAWLTTGSDRSGFGSFDDSDPIDDLTGGAGSDAFHSAADLIRDLRSDDSIIP